jgi:uncharacterized protein
MRPKTRTKRNDSDPAADARVSDAQTLEVQHNAQGVSFAVRIAPRAARTAVTGVHAGALKLSVAAPPVDGEANAELCAHLAKLLGVPKRNLVIAQGERGKSKVVRVSGVTEDAVRALVRG